MHFFYVQKLFLTQNFLLFAEINLTTWGPLYTCLVIITTSVKSFNLEFSAILF